MLTLTEIASLATALALIIGAWELFLTKKLTQTSYEDGLEQKYLELQEKIPYQIFLGKPITSEDTIEEVNNLIFNYLDLSNHQVFLRSKKRITKDTWKSWAEGISETLKKPYFKDMWLTVKKDAPGELSYLERLENDGFEFDPAKWS